MASAFLPRWLGVTHPSFLIPAAVAVRSRFYGGMEFVRPSLHPFGFEEDHVGADHHHAKRDHSEKECDSTMYGNRHCQNQRPSELRPDERGVEDLPKESHVRQRAKEPWVTVQPSHVD